MGRIWRVSNCFHNSNGFYSSNNEFHNIKSKRKGLGGRLNYENSVRHCLLGRGYSSFEGARLGEL